MPSLIYYFSFVCGSVKTFQITTSSPKLLKQFHQNLGEMMLWYCEFKIAKNILVRYQNLGSQFFHFICLLAEQVTYTGREICIALQYLDYSASGIVGFSTMQYPPPGFSTMQYPPPPPTPTPQVSIIGLRGLL